MRDERLVRCILSTSGDQAKRIKADIAVVYGLSRAAVLYTLAKAPHMLYSIRLNLITKECVYKATRTVLASPRGMDSHMRKHSFHRGSSVPAL